MTARCIRQARSRSLELARSASPSLPRRPKSRDRAIAYEVTGLSLVTPFRKRYRSDLHAGLRPVDAGRLAQAPISGANPIGWMALR